MRRVLGYMEKRSDHHLHPLPRRRLLWWLRLGWEEHRTDIGTPYYVNHLTRTTVLERPVAVSSAAEGTGGGGEAPLPPG